MCQTLAFLFILFSIYFFLLINPYFCVPQTLPSINNNHNNQTFSSSTINPSNVLSTTFSSPSSSSSSTTSPSSSSSSSINNNNQTSSTSPPLSSHLPTVPNVRSPFQQSIPLPTCRAAEFFKTNRLPFTSTTSTDKYNDSNSYQKYNISTINNTDYIDCDIGPHIRIGYLPNIWGKSSSPNTGRQGAVVSGAMTMAVDSVNRNTSLLNGIRLEFLYNNTDGDTLASTQALLYQWAQGAIAFIGLEESCEVEATVAAALNLPVISHMCVDSKVSRKDLYPTFARTYPPDTQVIRSVMALLDHYKWRKFSILYEDSPRYRIVARSLAKRATDRGLTVNMELDFPNFYACCEKDKNSKCCSNSFDEVIEKTRSKTRIYILLGPKLILSRFMMRLSMKNLLENGEYIVIAIDFETFMENISWEYIFDKSHEKLLTIEAARSLLIIAQSPPHGQAFRDFEDEVHKYNRKPPFNFPNIDPLGTGARRHVTMYAAHLYDAVILYAEAIASMLRDKLCPRNGTEVIQRIIKRKRYYSSVTGTWMNIDENGDVEGNFTLLAVRPIAKTHGLRGFYDHNGINYTMLPVGSFDYDELNNGTTLRLGSAPIDWISGSPPVDEPPCGFDGNKCIRSEDSRREIIAGILAGLFITISVIFAITYRNWKYEQEIAGLLWKIQLRDLQMYHNGFSPLSASRMSFTSAGSTESRLFHQVFTQTAIYRGTIVAIKELRFSRKSIDLPREMKKEMKLMKELHHDKINSFIGAYIEPNGVYIVTEYCAKGSLQDILDNKNLKLDGMFVASLVFDLISAMIYLHDSDIKVHGNLKSTNCLITSRWVLKVTDFGLHQLRKSADTTSIDSDSYYRNLLYTPPELLREPSMRGTPKGDVYAFSIILHEIAVREGPFSLHVLRDRLNPRMIVDYIAAGPSICSDGQPFRPSTSNLQCQDYVINTMKDCWAEEPEHRPDFRLIRTRLKKMRQGLKTNIMDNMMIMMEKYTNNLEDLVEERTEQLAEEKKKTESLLHRMLPKTVAADLVRGECVTPESFDAVTIFFSDIVGFTAMSAESTPMEVVTFLNDLYTLFDSIISSYDVYKVETIGDAYMVVSGLPIRNGDKHASEIASMALELLDSVRTFKIRHRANQTLQLRIGVHTGPVVAGVVGTTMPRYCLFGDTVNTASRMESNGEPLKIHISPQCREYLVSLGGYIIKERGYIKMKGKGEVLTYWLIGHIDGIHHRIDPIGQIEYPTGHPPSLFAGIVEASSGGKRRGSPKVPHSGMVRRGSSVTFRGIDGLPSGLLNRHHASHHTVHHNHSHSDSGPNPTSGSPKMVKRILKNVHTVGDCKSYLANSKPISEEPKTPRDDQGHPGNPFKVDHQCLPLTQNPNSVPSHLDLSDGRYPKISPNFNNSTGDDNDIKCGNIFQSTPTVPPVCQEGDSKINQNFVVDGIMDDVDQVDMSLLNDDESLDETSHERRDSRAALLHRPNRSHDRCHNQRFSEQYGQQQSLLLFDGNKNFRGSEKKWLSCNDLIDVNSFHQPSGGYGGGDGDDHERFMMMNDQTRAQTYAKYLCRGASYLQFNYNRGSSSLKQWIIQFLRTNNNNKISQQTTNGTSILPAPIPTTTTPTTMSVSNCSSNELDHRHHHHQHQHQEQHSYDLHPHLMDNDMSVTVPLVIANTSNSSSIHDTVADANNRNTFDDHVSSPSNSLTHCDRATSSPSVTNRVESTV